MIKRGKKGVWVWGSGVMKVFWLVYIVVLGRFGTVFGAFQKLEVVFFFFFLRQCTTVRKKSGVSARKKRESQVVLPFLGFA